MLEFLFFAGDRSRPIQSRKCSTRYLKVHCISCVPKVLVTSFSRNRKKLLCSGYLLHKEMAGIRVHS